MSQGVRRSILTFWKSTDLQVPSDPSQQHRTERYGTRRALLVRFARVSVCHRLQSKGHGQQTGKHEQLAEKSKKHEGMYTYKQYIHIMLYVLYYINIFYYMILHYIILYCIILYYIVLYYIIILYYIILL